VVDGVTGFVVDGRVAPVRDALRTLIGDDALRRRMGDAARARAVADLSYDRLVEHLRPVAAGDLDALVALGGPADTLTP
jgi:glycosyltransferase involved in cell wall biosynthesis